jgi:TRAP-type mannitol/chloroaromatic compound transport system substrate-binding protein
LLTILKKKQILLIAMMLVFLFILIAGCAPIRPTAPAPEAPKPQVHNLRIATTWPSAIVHHQMPVRWAEEVKAASGGRLNIEVHPAGAVVPAPEVLTATNARAIDGYHTFGGYWIGKMPAAPFFSSIPMMFEPFMYLVWIYEGGGLELWQRMYDEAGFNVKIIPLGLMHPEVLAWSNKPLRKIEDWKGLKYRTVGWWGEILRERGISVTSIPPAELYPAMERGVLDAMEFASPYSDTTLRFHEVAKYMTGPGMHQPGVLFYVGINKDSWNALPPDMQALIKTAARSATLWSWTHDFSESMEALDYVRERGLEFVVADESLQRLIKADAYAMFEKRAAQHGGIFAETWESIKKFRARFIEYEKLMMPMRIK